jgi:hypothetical protein
MNIAIKIIITLLSSALAIFPYLADNPSGRGLLDEIGGIGPLPAVLIALSFLVAIAFYCRTLQKILMLIAPENRTARYGSCF